MGEKIILSWIMFDLFLVQPSNTTQVSRGPLEKVIAYPCGKDERMNEHD